MKKLKKRYFILILLCFVLIASFLVSVSLGSVMVPFGNTFKILFMSKTGFIGQDEVGVQRDIILKIRVPRVFLGMIVGAALSVSGLIFQALLKNPLAAPHTLGVTAGASFGAAIAIFLSYVIHANVKTFLPLFAFLGGLSTVFLVYMLAKTKGRVQVLTMILAGVVVSYLFSSGLVLIMSLMGDRSHEIIYWLMGSLAGYHRYLPVAAVVVFSLTIFMFSFFRDLDLISLGDDQAKSLGVNIEFIRIILFSTSSLITAVSVSLTGTIGFVGLIVPHSMRLLFGPRHKMLIPASVVAGASFLPLSDTLARTLPALLFQSGMDIPVGVVTSLFGSPFFIFLLIRGKKSLWF